MQRKEKRTSTIRHTNRTPRQEVKSYLVCVDQMGRGTGGERSRESDERHDSNSCKNSDDRDSVKQNKEVKATVKD